MPNRIVKESICTSETLASVSAEAERLFIRLITRADDFGIYPGNIKVISSTCFPITTPKEEKISLWLSELININTIVLCVGEDLKIYVKFLNWKKYQTVRAAKSKYPSELADTDKCKQMIAKYVADNRMQLKSNVPVFENVNENVNVNENEILPKQKTRLSDTLDDGFVLFWDLYPRKNGKKDATKAWASLKPSPELAAEIIAGVKRWSTSIQWTEDGGTFIPYPATFLRGERWKDEVGKPVIKRAYNRNNRSAPQFAQRDYDDDYLKQFVNNFDAEPVGRTVGGDDGEV